MKKYVTIAGCAVALMMGVPAIAQTAAPAAAGHYSTQDTTIGTLLADPAAKAIVDAHIPGLSSDSSIAMISGMSLRAVQPMAGDKINVGMLDAIDADLAKIPAK